MTQPVKGGDMSRPMQSLREFFHAITKEKIPDDLKAFLKQL
jgi:hypothetical protein